MDILIFFISLTAAFLFSLGGIGAAIILIPILVSLGIPVNTAKPVGLFYNTVSMLGASVNNIRNKRLDFKAGIPIIIFSFIFAILGAWVSKFIPATIILLLFIAFLLFSSAMFFFHTKKDELHYRSNNPYLKLSLIGSLAGLLSGLLGGITMGLIFNAWGANALMQFPWWQHLMVGGFAFGLTFMATDPVTAAQTNKGKWIYGFLIGMLAIMIRTLNPAYPEGVMLAILLMNVVAPTIDYFVVEANVKKRMKRAAVTQKN